MERIEKKELMSSDSDKNRPFRGIMQREAVVHSHLRENDNARMRQIGQKTNQGKRSLPNKYFKIFNSDFLL